MFEEKIELFSRLLREVEADVGTNDTATLVMNAALDSIRHIKAKDKGEFCKKFGELVHVLSNTEPKFGVIVYHLDKLAEKFKNDMPDKGWRKFALAQCEDVLKCARQRKRDIIKNSNKINVEGKTILIHDHSHTVQDVLVHYKRTGKHFRVVIAEQDFDKTHSNIEKMHAARIPFQVVPAYMLSHILDEIDMVFFGGLTLKDTMHFVMDPGTHGIISEMHVEKKPIYMFIDSAKFSLWKSKKRGDIFIHKHLREHHARPIEYERIKYSHDRVPLELFTKVVTNEKIMTPKETVKMFEKKVKQLG